MTFPPAPAGCVEIHRVRNKGRVLLDLATQLSTVWMLRDDGSEESVLSEVKDPTLATAWLKDARPTGAEARRKPC